jgi:hypothetical protein
MIIRATRAEGQAAPFLAFSRREVVDKQGRILALNPSCQHELSVQISRSYSTGVVSFWSSHPFSVPLLT